MKPYLVGFSHYGLKLNVGDNPTYQDLLNAYLSSIGGAQNAFNYITQHLNFIEDTIKDATIIEENNADSNSSEEAPN